MMNFINYEYYRIFYHVARCHSITKAAQLLGANQPNISRIITKLEDELHCSLFTRSARGVSLTEEGKVLYRHISIAVEQIEIAENKIYSMNQCESGHISIGCTEMALNLFLLDKLQIFHEEYPGIQLHITNHSSPQAIKALQNDSVDCAIVTSPIVLENDLQSTRLDTFQEILIGGPKMKTLSYKQHLQDIADYPLIMLGQDSSSWNHFYKIYMNHHLAMKADIEVATAEQIILLAQQNLGLGFLPERMVADKIADGSLCHIPLYEEIASREILLVENPKRSSSVALKTFIRILNE